MKIYISLIILCINTLCISQTKVKQEFVLKTDSCVLLAFPQKEEVQLMQVKIKNDYLVQFIKQNQKKYLKIIVRNDLGYGKTGSLILYSNKKQFYLKTIKLNIIDKQSAYFILDLEQNYLVTLKDNGLTSLLFCENVEFIIPKADTELIKQAATVFYSIVVK